ncbi:hypothetical protein ACFXGA_37855 [Actinosynnema sp. NPDC059335]|uniref:hypothetical protein n=1 Tax=Actinosynnema sp. NPDC059335 TaxID=3346804 RepID=UPI00367334B8
MDPAVLHEHSAELHARLHEPLIESLRLLGEPDPGRMAELINAAVLRAAQNIEADGVEAVPDLLDRLLRPYLDAR